MTFDEFPINSLPPPKNSNSRRWYDESFVRGFVDALEEVPPYKRDNIAHRIVDTVESVFKNEINRKVNTNKNMILGMYKEFEKRRWYDRNPIVLKAVKSMCTLVDQRRDLQRMAIAGIVEALGEYYKKEEPKVEIRQPEPIIQKAPEPIIEEPVAPEPEDEPKKKPDSKVMVSGEKLFIKRDKKLKPKPKEKPKI
ncbi:MAG: hypothetical protein AB1782_11395 [Cyanobacteriota bacterium]